MLQDSESVVAFKACQAIQQRNLNDLATIKALIRVLDRTEIAIGAVYALERLGSDARIAVPDLLKHTSTISWDRYQFDSRIEVALNHIGPPEKNDLPRILPLLTVDDPDRTILAVKSISLLGKEAQSASTKFDSMARQLLEHAVATRNKYADADEDAQDQHDNSYDLVSAAESCIVGHWIVTGDADRFLEMIEHYAVTWNEEFSFYGPLYEVLLWKSFDAQDIGRLSRLLDAKTPEVFNSGLGVLDQLGTRASRFADLLCRKFNDNSIAREQLARTIATIGPSGNPEKAMVVLANAFDDKQINSEQLASIVEHWSYSNDRVTEILTDGLADKSEYRTEATACAKALCKISKDHNETAKLVIKNLGDRPRNTIESLMLLSSQPPAVLGYLTEHLSSSDIWAQKEALDALAKMKITPAGVIRQIEQSSKSYHLETKIAAAKTRFLLTGNKKQLDDFLLDFIDKNNPDNKGEWDVKRKCFLAIRAIGELEQRGQPFVNHIKAIRKRYEWEYSESICLALKNIGGDEAIEILNELSRSKDWQVKTSAIEALEDLNQKPEVEIEERDDQ